MSELLREGELQATKMGLPVRAEYFGNRHGHSSLEFVVEVEERPPQLRRHPPPDRRFASPGQPDEDDVGDHRPLVS